MAEDDDPIIYLQGQKRQKDWIKSAFEMSAANAQARHNSHLRELDPIFNMGPKEAAAFVRRSDNAMKSHASDFRHGHDSDAALSAFEHAMAILLEIRPAYPAEHANIDEVLRRHGYSIIET